MWQDKPQESPWPDSDEHTSQRLGSLLSSNKWQIQHEHLLQNVSSADRTALHAEFLHIHELEHPNSEDCSEVGGKRTGFSPFLFCFLAGWLLGLEEDFFGSCFLFVLLVTFAISVDLLFDGMEFFFSLSKHVFRSSFLGPDFINSWSSSGLLEASSECPFFSGVLCTLEERLWTPEAGHEKQKLHWEMSSKE